MITATQVVEDLVYEMTKEVTGFINKKQRIRKCKVLGTMTQMVSDMEDRFNAQHEMLKTLNTTYNN